MKSEVIDFHRSYPFQPIDTFSHVRLSDVDSLNEVLGFMSALRQAHPGHRFLCTLDDLGQCCYTSMHAAQHDDLYLDSDDVDDADPDAVHAHEGRMLAHIVAQLTNPQRQVTWEALPDALEADDEMLQALVDANRTPSRVLDDVVYIQRLPVADDDLLIAGLPNGYFTCDLDIFQNHAVIRRMAERHGYRFFGIGASWLGFVRTSPPDAAGVERLIADLSFLYRRDAASSPAWQELSATLAASAVLMLGYTESFEA